MKDETKELLILAAKAMASLRVVAEIGKMMEGYQS